MLRLRRKVIAIYPNGFPSTLSDFDSRTFVDAEFLPEYIMGLISLFRETSALECLPVTFYFCSRLPMDYLLKGRNGVTLAWEDQVACIMGREALLRAQEELSHSFIFRLTSPVGCTTRGLCARRAKRSLNRFHHEISRLYEVFALTCLKDWSMMDGICAVCVNRMELDHKAGRQAVWNSLPKYFGLGSWDEIEKGAQRWSDEEAFKKVEE